MSVRRSTAVLAAALAAVLPAAGPAGPIASAPTAEVGQQQTKQAKPEATAVQSIRLSRRMGPLGLPRFAETGGRPPWVDKHGGLLRQVR
jgi:hypothetical protein